MAIQYSKGASTPPLPVGKYAAGIAKIAVLGTHDDPFNAGKTKTEVFFEFAVLNPDTGKTVPLMRTCTPSMFEKSKLVDLIETVDDDFEGKDLNALLGKSLQVRVEHSDKGRAKISKWYPEAQEVPIGETVYFDFDPVDEDALARMPDWVQKKIQDSPEWRAYEKSKDASADLDDALDEIGDLV